MKNGRKIAIKDRKLKQIRYDLRKILSMSISNEIKSLRKLRKHYEIDINLNLKKINELNKEEIELSKARSDSILICSGRDCKGISRKNMVYDAETESWYCESCYDKLLERRSPEKMFNQGIIVHENAQKPCHELKWCPYGPYVERFPIKVRKSKYSCLVFGHDCPVFYISEKFTEDSSKIPSPNEKFIEKKRWLLFNTNEENLSEDIPKPCHELDWCPYGPIVQYSKERKKLTRTMCFLFKKDCPAFYLSQNIVEDLSFQSK